MYYLVFTGDVTGILETCHRGVTCVLQRWYRELLTCYKVSTEVLQGCYRGVKKVVKECYRVRVRVRIRTLRFCRCDEIGRVDFYTDQPKKISAR